MSLSIVPNALIRKKLITELEKGHFQVAIIGGILQLPWTLWESLFTNEFWLPILYMRIFTCVLPVFLYFTHKKLRVSSSLSLLLLVLSISFLSFFAISHLDIEGFKIYSFGIISFFLGTGMLVTWEFKYSVIYLVCSILFSGVLFYLNSPLSFIEILINGGFAFYTIGVFSIVLIYIRYSYRFNDLKTRTKLENSIDELNEKTNENKTLYEELQRIDKSAIVAEMTSSVAHELNTPISVLKNSSDILVESFHEVLKLPNQGVNWTDVNYILLKLSDRPMITSYFDKIKETDRISKLLKSVNVTVADESIQLLVSSGINIKDKELLDLIFSNISYSIIIQLVYQLRIIHVMNNNISSSVNQTAKIIQELKGIQLKTKKAERSAINLKLSFEKATNIFEFQTRFKLSIKITIDDLIEINTSKLKLIQLWVKLFEFIAISNEINATENILFITASAENSSLNVKFQLAEEKEFNQELLSNVNSIFTFSAPSKMDNFNLNILRTLIADFNFEVKISDTALFVIIPMQ